MTGRERIVAVARAMVAQGLARGRSGNVSMRDGAGMLITPSGVDPAALTPDSIAAMDLDGGFRGPLLPSSEWLMHAAIYRARPEAGAVVHTHSPHATALSCRREAIPAFHYMVAVAGGPTVRCADYATFGTPELAEAVLAALVDRRACLLANHGAIGFAATPEAALDLMAEIEGLAQGWWIARQGGEPVILDDAEMERVAARFATYGQAGADPAAQAAVIGVRRLGP